MPRKQKWFLLSLLLGLGLAACGGPQQDYYKPATEVLATGNVLFCPSRGDLTITKNGVETIEGQMKCQRIDSGLAHNDIIETDQVEFVAPTDQVIFSLVDVHYGWGVVTDENGHLLQIYEQGQSGWVHIHWPPPQEQETE